MNQAVFQFARPMKRLFLGLLALIYVQSLWAQQSPIGKPPKNWHHQDYTTDGFRGISTDKAYEILKDRTPRKIIVAVIDSGVDWEHEDLKDVIWINQKEIENNGMDDDGNGFIDDFRGWNFLGSPDGHNISKETLEVTREFRRLNELYGNKTVLDLNANQRDEFFYYERVRDQFYSERQKFLEQYNQIKQIYERFTAAEDTIKKAFGLTSINPQGLEALDMDGNLELIQARNFLVLLDRNGISGAELSEAYEQYDTYVNYGYNVDFDPRGLVENNYYNFDNRFYGNPDTKGPDSKHGTHVAGIIAAKRGNGIGTDGVADNVEIMIIRAVPDGDEYDKDVANAIRYAVDNGAHIINMSFGKSLSPQKFLVDDAVRYAQKKGVLLIHAAGNDGVNLDSTENYPTAQYTHTRKTFNNWIEVGASSHGGPDNFVASFSNYGKRRVHVFAPGNNIYAPTPENQYDYLSGTSMAAPVVSGIAALLMSYYPKMKTRDVIRVIMDSSVKFKGTMVKRPGAEDDEPYIDFAELSMTGGIVNAYEAVKMAQRKYGK
jgi:subtilisin family serine protease